jgi:lipopolysaccharide transport system ATP-binding protein
MVMRLAFSIAIHADPKCFVVDEALSVGDAHFQQKCMNRIRAFRENGGSIIFVSHDLNAIKMLCDKAILLNQGTVVEVGNPETVVNRYNFLISKLKTGK